jgi:rRNA processing protein Gar1
LKGWVKLNLHYIGKSRKHQIFRAKKWDKRDERIFQKPVYNEKYKQIGLIKEIFGPARLPFISIKTTSEQELNSMSNLYVKV